MQAIKDEAQEYIARCDFDKVIETKDYILIGYTEETEAIKYTNAYLNVNKTNLNLG